jgi:hypothetical protein
MRSVKRIASMLTEVLTWLWVARTLAPVALYGGAVLVDPSTTARIMGYRADGVLHSAVGLTFTGLGGAALVLLEIVLVAGALLLSRSTNDGLRRAALCILVGWTLLWLGNAVWLDLLAGGRASPRTIVAAVALVVVLTRTVLLWREATER